MSRNNSPIKPWSAKNSPKKGAGLFLLTNAGQSGKKKEKIKEPEVVKSRRDELSKPINSCNPTGKMFSGNRDEVLNQTMQDV